MNSIFRRGRLYFSGSLGKFRLTAVLLIVAGVLLRIEYLREFHELVNFDLPIGADIAEYHQRAREILNGQIFPLQEEIHAPLYSFFLAGLYYLTDSSVGAVRLIQLILNFAAWLGLFYWSKQAGLPQKVRLSFLGLAMLTPTLIFHQAELISESLILPLVAGSLILLSQSSPLPPKKQFLNSLGAGALLGMAVLTHGALLAFLGCEMLYLMWQKKWRIALGVVGAALLIILPVIAAKSWHYHHLSGIQANGGFNFFLGNNPQSTGGCYLRPGLAWRQHHRTAQMAAQRQQISTDAYWLHRAGEFWAQHPWRGLKLYCRKALLIWSPVEEIAGSDPGALLCRTDVIFWGRFLTPVIFLLFFAGLIRLYRERPPYQVHFLLLVASSVLLQLFFVTSGRYRSAMFPALLWIGAWGSEYFWSRYRWTLLIAVGAICGYFSWNFATAHPAEAQALLGEAYYLKGDFNSAETCLKDAQAGNYRDPAQIGNLLGAIAEARGQLPQAFQAYRQVVQVEPEMPEAWMNLGNLLGAPGSSSQGRQAAQRCFQRAFQVAPGSADLHFNYARFLQNQRGSAPEIEKHLHLALQRNKQHAPSWNALGIRALNQKNFATAVKCFERAAAAAPQEIGYRRNLEIARQLAQ